MGGGRLRFIVGELRLSAKTVEVTCVFRHFTGVNLLKFLALLLTVALLAGCKKTETPAEPVAAPMSIDDVLPKQAQPKLPTMKIYLGAEILDAELALTPRQEMTGMMYRTNIQDTDAMLFVLPAPQQASFWMKKLS